MLKTVQETMTELIHFITDVAEERSLHGCSGDLRKLRDRLKILNTFISKQAIAREVINDIERLPYMFSDKLVYGMVNGYVQNETERPCDTDCVFTQLDKTVLRLLDTVSVCKTKVKAHVNSEYDLGDYYTPDEQIKAFQDIVDKKDPEIFNYKSFFDVKYESIPDTNSYLAKEELESLYLPHEEYDPVKELEDLKKLGWVILKEV